MTSPARSLRHLLSYLSEDELRKVLRLHCRAIAGFVHAQMLQHFWHEAKGGYDVKVTRSFEPLRDRAYTRAEGEPLLDFRVAPADKSKMAGYLFGGFSRCLYREEKFQSDAERKLAVILDREALKWFKPARGQFQLYYRSGTEDLEYQPDFVAETRSRIMMLEPKASNQLGDPDVLAKRAVAVEWCRHASDHAAAVGGKPWTYLLIPHDAIAQNVTLEGLAQLDGDAL
jgi:type III restriction enzyme